MPFNMKYLITDLIKAILGVVVKKKRMLYLTYQAFGKKLQTYLLDMYFPFNSISGSDNNMKMFYSISSCR